MAVAGNGTDAIEVIGVRPSSMEKVTSLRRIRPGAAVFSMSFELHGTKRAVASARGLYVFVIAWEDASPDSKTPTRAVSTLIKLKDQDCSPAWVFFFQKTHGLGGVTTRRHSFNVVLGGNGPASAVISKDSTPGWRR